MARTILVVDDEPDLVATCERLLGRVGHLSLRAHTGPDAMALIDRESPDLVVADLRLPGIDGLTVARHAHGHVPPIPVILMTAYDSPQARSAARESGVGVYLAKPFSNAAFLDAIQRALSSRPTAETGEGSRRTGDTVTQQGQVRSLLDDLRRPEAYPVPRPSQVTQVTTHISWVFLTDRDAWKLKRPVDHGFVDYTTLERRRRFCEDEVRLNRRLAPGVYRGVVPVRLGPQGHWFGPEGDVVDYAVRMRRLPDERSADALLRRGSLTAERLARLADRLARFFAGAAPAPSMGAIEVIRDNVTENFAQVEPFVGRFVSRQTLDAVREWQLGALERDPGRFRARVEQGWIRDGHGDLRLEHVYFEDADPIVIDCVEFNERLRCGDAAADVAFLAMELTARSRADLAELFLAAFALEADDHDLYGVVDFYAGYRAWVRGKVAAFLAADPSTPPDKATRKAEEARTLFTLARSYAQTRPGAPPVVAVGGLIGSGKSTLAEALGRAAGVPVISADRTRKALAGVRATEPAPDSAYSAAFSARTFDELFRRAAVVLGSGRGVVLDATFRERGLRLRAGDLARRHGRRFLFAETVCDEATLRDRLRRRAAGPSVSDAREALLERVRAEFEPVIELDAGEHVRIDTSGPPEAAVRAVLARLPA